jgi:hypothetical protein
LITAVQPRIGRSEENSAARAQESQSSSLRANAGDGQGVGSIATIATISEANPTFIRRAIRICNMVDMIDIREGQYGRS